MWNLVLGPIVSGVSNYFSAKAEIKKAKVEGEIKVIQQAANDITAWERIHATGSQASWKDEFWTLIFSVPLIMGFVPGGKVYVDAGFEALAQMPEWYQYTLVTLVLASFGIRVTSTVKNLMSK